MNLINQLKIKIANSKVSLILLLAALFYQISINDKYHIKNKINKYIFIKVINFYKGISLLPQNEIEDQLKINTKIILNYMKLYYFLGYCDFKNAEILIENNLRDINFYQLKINQNLKNVILMSNQILLQELKINNWIYHIEKNLISLDQQLTLNNIDIKNCYNKYHLFEENSHEHLELTKKHLEALVSSAILEGQKKDILDLSYEDKNIGNEIIFEINNLSNIILNTISSSYHSQLLLNKLSILKIKLEFYLGKDQQQLINQLGNICNIHIKKGNLDPIGHSMGLYDYPLLDNNYKEILNFSILNKSLQFNRYLNCFILEINKKKNNADFKLKQLSNFEANSIKERLIINKL